MVAGGWTVGLSHRLDARANLLLSLGRLLQVVIFLLLALKAQSGASNVGMKGWCNILRALGNHCRLWSREGPQQTGLREELRMAWRRKGSGQEAGLGGVLGLSLAVRA